LGLPRWQRTLAPVRAVLVVPIEEKPAGGFMIRNRMCVVKRHPRATDQRPLTAQTESLGKGMASLGTGSAAQTR
jgi:hypothetical protein